ncbi:hypothetical protein KVT40_002987 [Elsinoe batatas]|uniref:Uncharacterized protein n=1 Tax=Elsinoe batatas TaxID=2601811 RepID=A0A8K0L4P3_9PEZI|nr:hypothetical protein KVT40_002987 [Elsinoe batatas]
MTDWDSIEIEDMHRWSSHDFTETVVVVMSGCEWKRIGEVSHKMAANGCEWLRDWRWEWVPWVSLDPQKVKSSNGMCWDLQTQP